MSKYKYEVWNDGLECSTHCYLSITNGERVIADKEFIQPSIINFIFLSSNKLIEAMLKKGHKIAKERIAILINNERLRVVYE